jgi:hypothetical protein
MARIYDEPSRPEATVPPSHRRRREKAEVERGAHAYRRFLVAKTAAQAAPRPRDMVAAVKAISDQLGGWTPSRPAICALADEYLNGDAEMREHATYYAVQGHGGRHLETLPPALQAWLVADVDGNPGLETFKFIERPTR